jgi:hypothetical protein
MERSKMFATKTLKQLVDSKTNSKIKSLVFRKMIKNVKIVKIIKNVLN